MREVQIYARPDLHQSCRSRRTFVLLYNIELRIYADGLVISARLPLIDRPVTQKPSLGKQVSSLSKHQANDVCCKHLLLTLSV